MESSVNDKGISYLVHFTRVENLQSILTNGLIPVKTLRDNSNIFFHNDDYRLDRFENANCLSIQFPNYKMFYKYQNEDPASDWVILGIRKEVLWEKDCAFCIENAASNNVRNIPLQNRRGLNAFNQLYTNYPNKPDRSILGIKSSYPTHPQAEILVFDVIEPTYIIGVAFKNLEKQNLYQSQIPEQFTLRVKPELFYPREDYTHWY